MNAASFVAAVEQNLRSLLNEQKSLWTAQQREMAQVFDVIGALALAPGKRVRPQCVDLGWRAAGGARGHLTPIQVGAAMELVHVSALLHDDIIDDAATRRGTVTAHRAAAAEHERNQWAGEHRRFGEGVALLAGDVALTLADFALGDVNSSALAQWRAVRLDVTLGQFLDHVATARRVRETAVSEVIVRLKTAQYTIVRPLLLGAYAADESHARLIEPVLTSFGAAIGRAFQLHDDLLGVFGDSSVVGKPVGDDLREGKPTVLLALAYERADEFERRLLDMVGTEAVTDSDLERVMAVMETTGARASVHEEIAHLTQSAIDAISQSSIAADVVEDLSQLAVTLMNRQA